ncbi:hypothetical protein [Maricaulis sp.]|uniref:hypothetical protein n=1 Tax=Maricaulis sp. TaxID=1486257 RepID=UPI003A8ED088
MLAVDTRTRVLTAFDRFDAGERPDHFGTAVNWTVRHPGSDAEYPAKAIWCLAQNISCDSLSSAQARPRLVEAGFELSNSSASKLYATAADARVGHFGGERDDLEMTRSGFLLTWKPEHWPIEHIERLIAELQAGKRVIEPWRVAAHTKAQPGDRVWLLRQGKPRGIIGTGRIAGGRVDVEVGETRRPGFPIEFDRLVHPDEGFLISDAALGQILETVQLNSQSSGTQLRAGQAESLMDAIPSIEQNVKSAAFATAFDRVVRRTLNTVAGANGQETVRTIKNKTLGFPGGRNELMAYIQNLFADQDGRCALTDLPMLADGSDVDPACLLSLDRIDSDKGYEPGNLQLVCHFANMWKCAEDDGEFRRLVALVRSRGPEASGEIS